MKKALLIICGLIALTIAAIGIVLPVLPTTPFLLVAAGCFSASSKKLYSWMLKNRVFGAYIRHYREKTGISKYVKLCTLIFLYVGLILSAVLVRKLAVSIALGVIAVLVTVHILMIKPKKPPLNLDKTSDDTNFVVIDEKEHDSNEN